MFVPGALTSGLSRPSSHGPRDENSAIPAGSSETWPAAANEGNPLVADQLTFTPGVGVEPDGRLFSVAPTVRTFFAVPGVPIESPSICTSALSSRPLLPAEKITSASRRWNMYWSTARVCAS
jgi:hypothetical protein